MHAVQECKIPPLEWAAKVRAEVVRVECAVGLKFSHKHDVSLSLNKYKDVDELWAKASSKCDDTLLADLLK